MDQKTLNLNDYYYSQQQIDAKLNAARITAQSDLNEYKTPGKYYCATKADGQTMINSPWAEGTGYAFSLVVLKHSNSGIRQILFGNTSSNQVGADIWTRNLNTSQSVDTWGSWFKIYGTNNIDNIITLDNLSANNIVTSDNLITEINQQLQAVLIAANANLNDYTTPGKYYCATKADGKTVQNSPWEGNDYGYAFGLEVARTASSGYKQTIFGNVSNSNIGADIWTRNYNLVSGSPQWGEWYKIYGNNNLNVDNFITVNNMTSTHNIVTSNNLNNLLNTYLTNNHYLSSSAISHHGGILITADNDDSSAPKVIQTVAKLGQDEISWSNQSTNILNPIDQGSISDFSTNRLAFLDPDCIRIMESKPSANNTSETWRDYDFRTNDEINNNVTLTQEIINRRKKEVLSGQRTLYGGGPKKSHSEANYDGPLTWSKYKKLRIIISAKKDNEYQCYAHLRKMYIHFNNNLSADCQVDVKVYKAGEYTDPVNHTGQIYPDDTDSTATTDTYTLNGQQKTTNWHSIPFLSHRKDKEVSNGQTNYILNTTASRLTGIYFGNYDENIGKNMSEVHYDKIVLTFSATKDPSSNTGGTTTNTSNTEENAMFSVDKIRFVGINAFKPPSVMADTGHIYNYDGDQNAVFPAQISAKGFRVPETSSGFLKSNGIVDTNTYVSKSEWWTQIANVTKDDSIGQPGYKININPALKLAQIYITYKPPTGHSGKSELLDLTEYNIGAYHLIPLSCNHSDANITLSDTTTDGTRKIVATLSGSMTTGENIQGYALWYYK